MYLCNARNRKMFLLVQVLDDNLFRSNLRVVTIFLGRKNIVDKYFSNKGHFVTSKSRISQTIPSINGDKVYSSSLLGRSPYTPRVWSVRTTPVGCTDYTCGAKSFYHFVNLQLVSFTDNSIVQKNTATCSLSEKERYYYSQKQTKASSENGAKVEQSIGI